VFCLVHLFLRFQNFQLLWCLKGDFDMNLSEISISCALADMLILGGKKK